MNRTIAIFDGWVSRLSSNGQHSKTPLWYKTSAGYAAWDLSAMKYHSDWNWLMSVAEKILSLDAGLNTYQLYLSDALRTADINEVYQSVYYFIESYNKNITNAAK